jgi:5-methylcytosine-specific restriction endonuclease McrA
LASSRMCFSNRCASRSASSRCRPRYTSATSTPSSPKHRPANTAAATCACPATVYTSCSAPRSVYCMPLPRSARHLPPRHI